MRIGIVISDSQSPNQAEFRFIASREVGTGQFVEARTPSDLFLGLITNVRMSNPDYEAIETIHHAITQKAETLFDTKDLEVYGRSLLQATVRVLGTFDVKSDGFDFTGKVVPPGSEVHTAEPKRLMRVLSEDPRGLHIGRVFGSEDVVVSMPVKSLYHHLAVVGSTGSGKSYAGAVICEELARKNLAVVVIDPHGEYASLQEPSKEMNSSEQALKLRVVEYTPGKAFVDGTRELSLRLSYLSVDDILKTMDMPGERQRILLYSAFQQFLERVETGQISDDLPGLLSVVREVGERGFGDTLASTIIRLSKLNELAILGEGVRPEDLAIKGTLTIVNVSGLDEMSEDIMVGSLLRMLFRERRREKIPDFVLVVEEIHRYAPTASTPTKTALASIVKEGRKFGIGIVALSQRPSDIDTAILTQCNTILILRLIDRTDIERVKNRLGTLFDLESSVQFFPTGRAILSGYATRFPLVFNIRKRFTNPEALRSRQTIHKPTKRINMWSYISQDSRPRKGTKQVPESQKKLSPADE